MPKPTPSRLLAAEVGKPHGISGDVYVVPISDDPHRFEPGSVLLRADGSRVVIEAARRHGNRTVVKFDGVDDRDEAEALRGALFVPAGDVRELDEDEFWPHDLAGCEVVLQDGDAVGRVKEVAPGAAHDLLVVETPRGERLVPFVKEIVAEVAPDDGRIVISPPEGLVD